jgi:hypothetical protein
LSIVQTLPGAPAATPSKSSQIWVPEGPQPTAASSLAALSLDESSAPPSTEAVSVPLELPVVEPPVEPALLDVPLLELPVVEPLPAPLVSELPLVPLPPALPWPLVVVPLSELPLEGPDGVPLAPPVLSDVPEAWELHARAAALSVISP